MQSFSRAAKAELFGDSDEVAEVTQFHGHSA